MSRNRCSIFFYIWVADSCPAPVIVQWEGKVERSREPFRTSCPGRDQFCNYGRGAGEFANDGQSSGDPTVQGVEVVRN